MRASLSTLPTELIVQIISYIHHLFNLALVSQRLHALTTPHLYRNIYLKREYIGGSIQHLLPFTFLILQRPGIASLVQSFTIDYKDEATDQAVPHLWPAGSEEVHNVLKPVIEAAAHSSEEESELFNLVLHKRIKYISVLALLLPALSKLRRLHMTINFSDDDEYLSPLFQRVATRQKPFDTHPAFTELTDIKIEHQHEHYDHKCPETFLACCMLPAVERICGRRMGIDLRVLLRPLMIQLRDTSLHINYIELRARTIGSTAISQVLITNKRHDSVVCTVDDDLLPADTEAIRDALMPHEEWLEELCPDHREYSSSNFRLSFYTLPTYPPSYFIVPRSRGDYFSGPRILP